MSTLNYLTPEEGLSVAESLIPALDEARLDELLLVVAHNVDCPSVEEFLVKHYNRMGADTRAETIELLGSRVYEPAIAILGHALEDPDEGVGAKAREAFLEFKRHREALEEFAAWTSGDRQAQAQIRDLMNLLESESAEVVLGAVRALGAIRARSALPALVRLLERDDKALREAVHEAIARIGG